MHDLSSITSFMEILKNQIKNEGSSMTLEEKAKAGQQLDALVKSASDALDILKELLREEAFQICKGKAGVCQLTPDCSVKYPYPTMKLRGDVDILELHNVLGDDFGDFIETTVSHSLRKDVQETVTGNPKYFEAVMDAVDIVEGTPRVFFKRGD
jgi:hypothetical protein